MLPNFLIIGAAKSGTTSLYLYLGQHPEIYVNAKEPSFFAFAGEQVNFTGPGDEHGLMRRIVTDFAAYQALFDGVTTERAFGEASVVYLYHPKAPHRIRQCIPDVKLIAILRNPVERAYSGYRHLRRDGREPLEDFNAALDAEESRIRAGWEHQWHYARMGLYHTQLKRYYDLFPRRQIAVYTYDDLKKRPLDMIQGIFRFLDVDAQFTPDLSLKHNVSGKPRMPALHSFLVKPNKVKDMVRPLLPRAVRRKMGLMIKQWNIIATSPKMSSTARQQLLDFYREEIEQLQVLIDRDLSHWLK